MQRRSSMFLILLCAANFEAGIVLNLILIFELFEARCSYKIVLIKEKEKECTHPSTWPTYAVRKNAGNQPSTVPSVTPIITQCIFFISAGGRQPTAITTAHSPQRPQPTPNNDISPGLAVC